MVTIATAKLLVIGDAIYFFFCTLIPCYIQHGNYSYRKIVGYW